EDAHSSRILLPLRRLQHRRTNVGLRSLFGRHGYSAVRSPHLSATLPGTFRNQFPGLRDIQPGRLDLVVGGHVALAAWVDARNRLSALSLGLLQRDDDDVSPGIGIAFPSLAGSRLGRLEADYL